MVHFYEGHECCLLNWKWKSLSLNQALRKTTSVSAGICSFVMPFYYAGSFGRITIWSFWNLEDVFKGKLCELVQLYFVRGIWLTNIYGLLLSAFQLYILLSDFFPAMLC